MAQAIPNYPFNPDSLEVKWLEVQCRPNENGSKMEPISDPLAEEMVTVRGVIEFQQRNEEGEVTKRWNMDIFHVPMSDMLRRNFVNVFTAFRQEVATAYLQPDEGMKLELNKGVYIERKAK